MRHCYYFFTIIFFLFGSSCKQDGSYSYINTSPVSTTNRLRSAHVYPYYEKQQYRYEPYTRPYSRAYSNPYARPPRDYHPYYDSDYYYVPPPEYYNDFESDHEPFAASEKHSY